MAEYTFTLLVLDGELPPLGMIAELASEADRIVCTDGAAAHLKLLVPPVDVIVGDMDSLEDIGSYVDMGVEIVPDGDQYSTDFEKALEYLLERQVQNVIVMGVSGKRLDHAMTNMSVLLRYTSRFSTLVAADLYGISYYLHGPIKRHFLEAKRAALVSLTPLPFARGVLTENLHYPVNNEAMIFGEREGLSNICTSDDGAFLSFTEGTMLVSIVTNPNPR